MKALKVILSIIFGFNIFVLTIIFSGLTAARMIVSGDNLGNIIKQAAEKEGVIELGFGSTGSVSSKELDKAMEEMSEYVDLDELYDEFGDFASKVINYYFGVSDDIDTAKLKKEIHKIAEKYEKKTGETVGWQKGFWFAVFTGVGGYFLWRLIKGMCREAVEFCKDEPKEENFREIKEEQDGSESV